MASEGPDAEMLHGVARVCCKQMQLLRTACIQQMLRVIMASVGRSIVPRRRCVVLVAVPQSAAVSYLQMHVATDMPYVTQIIIASPSMVSTARAAKSRQTVLVSAATARHRPLQHKCTCLKDGREHHLAIPAATSGIGCPSVAESP
jgi:hypothetical protein